MAKIPFGYEIIGGKAYVNNEEANQLKLYFRRFLEGESMAAAAQEARLPYSSSSYRLLLRKKEYIGTDYYPPIITEEYRKKLVAEWEKRKSESPRKPPKYVRKSVRVYTDFRLVRARASDPNDPVDCAAALYQRIRPHYKAPSGR